MDSDEERLHARELTRQADTAPAIARFRALLAFVADGRRATQAGKLTPSDALALARRLGMRKPQAADVRSMEDLPDVAHLVHWARAADLLAARSTKIVPGSRARDLGDDPLAAWFAAAFALVEHGLLDGFRRGWRKRYVGFLDASVPALLVAMVEAGGEVPITAIQASAWQQVADTFEYEGDDAAERSHVDWLVDAIVSQLANLGAAERDKQDVRLTKLGGALAAAIAIGADGLE